MTRVHLVLPHQLFAGNRRLQADLVVLVEHDLFFRQYPFHAQKLVLHRASMAHHAAELRDAGLEVEEIHADGRTTSRSALLKVLSSTKPTRLTWYDVADDWLDRDLRAVAEELEIEPDVRDSPNFLTTRAQVADQLGSPRTRMAHFYSWQRRRLDVLMDGDQPVGGRWSFDTENRKSLPRDLLLPPVNRPEPDAVVADAQHWVGERFPDAPGDASSFAWPVTHAQARTMLTDFLEHRLVDFGPYEDAITADHSFLFHGAITPALNIGLLDPADVLKRVVEHCAEHDVPLASYEGFVRQLIGWREYMRGTYVEHGRRLRTGNHLDHHRALPDGWWTAETGLEPVDTVLRRVLETGYAHHIERLMVLGNALCLLRVDPDAVYEWFMAMFVDAYDWVMVPNVYAMSQFAAGTSMTTKPYVSASSYLRKMSDIPRGPWCDAWDALFWTFVRDNLAVFGGNPRSSMLARQWESFDPDRKRSLVARARPWLTS